MRPADILRPQLAWQPAQTLPSSPSRTLSQLAKALPDTSLSLPAAAEAASSWLMACGEVLVEFCRISATTPATNGTAWEVPVRSLRE